LVVIGDCFGVVVGDCFEVDGFGGGCVGDTIVFSGVCGVSVLDLALLECG
jgi:hypothetical protein